MEFSTQSYAASLVSGGAAGLTVDVLLFPLDTIKTRAQCAEGFLKAGGFKNIYKGLSPQMVGSIPSAALFFCSYDSWKRISSNTFGDKYLTITSMTGASIGEMAACLVRVPTEIVKQRRQVASNAKPIDIIRAAYKGEGLKGFYRGYVSTVLREIPFSIIQFPIWEFLKRFWSRTRKNGNELTSYETAICGAISGGISAFVTTPLDVCKTRIMLAEKSLAETNKLKIWNVLIGLYKEGGIAKLFSGALPRTIWISIGGALFFGSYDLTMKIVTNR